MKKIPCFLLLVPILVFAAESYTLTLDEAVGLALERNEAVLAAQAKLWERGPDKGVAFSAFLPSVDLQGTYTRLGRVSAFTMLAAHDTIAPLPVYDTNGNLIGFTQPFLQTIGADSFSLPLSQRDNYVLR